MGRSRPGLTADHAPASRWGVPRRYFSLEQAQALIPRITHQLGTALQLHAHLRRAITDVDGDESSITFGMLRGEEELEAEDEDELAYLERARMLYTALRETVEDIESTGAEVRGVVDGLVDFYSWQDGHKEVMLCWKLGEPNIRHFHDLESGFDSRQSVDGFRFFDERAEIKPPPRPAQSKVG